MLENLPITILDIIALVIILVFALFATAKGFVHSILTVGSWIGAFFVASIGFSHVTPYAKQLTDIELLANAGSFIVLFLLSMVIFSMISHKIAGGIKDSALGPLDRALGFLLGLSFGTLLLCVFYLVTVSFLTEDNMPEVATESRGYPYIRELTHDIMAVTPPPVQEWWKKSAGELRDLKDEVESVQELKERLNNPLPSGKNQSQDQSGYSQEDRDQLDSLINDSN